MSYMCIHTYMYITTDNVLVMSYIFQVIYHKFIDHTKYKNCQQQNMGGRKRNEDGDVEEQLNNLLLEAARNSNIKQIRKLIKKGADVYRKNRDD